MKDNYEMKQFRKNFIILTVLFLFLLWLVSWICSDFSVVKALLITGMAGGFAGIVYGMLGKMLRRIF